MNSKSNLQYTYEEEKAIAENKANIAKKKTLSKQRLAEKDPNDPLSDKALNEEVEAAFKKYDLNEDGKLSREEAEEYIKAWCERRGLEASEVEEVVKFEDIDLNNDGHISKEELFMFIKDQRTLHSEMFAATQENI